MGQREMKTAVFQVIVEYDDLGRVYSPDCEVVLKPGDPIPLPGPMDPAHPEKCPPMQIKISLGWTKEGLEVQEAIARSELGGPRGGTRPINVPGPSANRKDSQS